VKASKGSIGRALDQPSPEIRFYLFHGPDEAQSRALAQRLADTLGASKSAMPAAAVRADPASLVDEASAMSLFGGKRVIWIEPATKDIEEGVAALLDAPSTESPVVAIAGSLTKSSPLLKLAEGSPRALAYASYVPEGQDAERMVRDIGRRFGLEIAPPLAARLADAAANDQAIVAQELQKFALYLDASPEAPKELDHAAIDAVGADNAEGDFQRLADLALAGQIQELSDGLARLPAGGSEAIPVIRSLQRRLLMLAPIRARMERGERLDAVMTSLGRALFWKDKSKVEGMLRKWSSKGLATAAERAGELERELMRPLRHSGARVPDSEALGEELLAIARKARSAR
jgi:DNA polymerase III subunit delta